MRGIRGREVRCLVVALALTASACGGGGDDGSETGGEPTSAPEPSPTSAPELRTVSADDLASADLVVYTGEAPQGVDNGGYGFAEDEISSPGPTITVAAGEKLSLVLFNVSEEVLGHDLTVVQRKDEAAPPLWGGQTETIQPGESTLVTFTPEEPGTYFYICSIISHTSGHGMWGHFVVE